MTSIMLRLPTHTHSAAAIADGSGSAAPAVSFSTQPFSFSAPVFGICGVVSSFPSAAPPPAFQAGGAVAPFLTAKSPTSKTGGSLSLPMVDNPFARSPLPPFCPINCGPARGVGFAAPAVSTQPLEFFIEDGIPNDESVFSGVYVCVAKPAVRVSAPALGVSAAAPAVSKQPLEFFIVVDNPNGDNSVLFMNENTMNLLDLFAGDNVLVTGKRKQRTLLICSKFKAQRPESAALIHEGSVGINACIRKNLGVKLGDVVGITKGYEFNSGIPYGTKVWILPFTDSIKGITGNLWEDWLKPYFFDSYRPLMVDNTFIVGKHAVPLWCGADRPLIEPESRIEFKVMAIEVGGQLAPWCIVTRDTEIYFDGVSLERKECDEMDEREHVGCALASRKANVAADLGSISEEVSAPVIDASILADRIKAQGGTSFDEYERETLGSAPSAPLHTIRLWRNGISCDDGPLFPHSDPRVTLAITEIGNGQVPRLFFDVLGRDPTVEIIGLQNEIYKVSASAAAAQEQRWLDAGKVVLKQQRGRGTCSNPTHCHDVEFNHDVEFSHDVTFNDFSTIVADVKLSKGCFYYEVGVLKCIGVAQFGVCTDGFEAPADVHNGVGDDSFSFAVDGVRQLKWPGGAYGSKWADGQVIGFAIDMRKEGRARMSVSVGGSFAAPNGLAFDAISAAWLSPAFSADFGKYRINFGDSPFKHYPPDAFYMSVHQACCISKGIATAFSIGAAAPTASFSPFAPDILFSLPDRAVPYVKSPIVLSYTHKITGRRFSISLVANGNLLTPAELRARIECPLQLLKAGAWFFQQRSPLGCKRRRQQQLFPHGFISAEYSACVPVHFMFGFVSTASQLLATAPVTMQIAYRMTRGWAERVMDRVMRGRLSSVQCDLLCLKDAAAARVEEVRSRLHELPSGRGPKPAFFFGNAAAASSLCETGICYSAERGDGGLVICHIIADADCINKSGNEL
jgi:hypothetical protein